MSDRPAYEYRIAICHLVRMNVLRCKTWRYSGLGRPVIVLARDRSAIDRLN